MSLGVGILGLGFMGQQHLASYAQLARDGLPLHIAALGDPDPERRALHSTVAGNIANAADLSGPALATPPASYATPEELLAAEAVQLVSICTYTESHVPLAIAALDAGKHVVVEKPVALDVGAVEELLHAARAHPDQLCMPALCMRFWPGWEDALHLLRRGTHGLSAPIVSAHFERRGARPGWGGGFYADSERCGGALFDLHVHDADFVRAAFGAPSGVATSGSLDDLRSEYHFRPAHSPEAGSAPGAVRAPHRPELVTARGQWLDDPEAPFHMGFEIRTAEQSLRYVFGETPQLLLERDGVDPVALPLEARNGYDGELAHAVQSVLGLATDAGRTAPACLLADAPALTAMLLAERESLANDGALRAL